MKKPMVNFFALAFLLTGLGWPLWAEPENPPKDAVVWAVDDTDKVHPITGALLSEGIEVYRGDRPSQRVYRRKNNVWDAATGTVKLFAGRNEFVSFQIVLEKGKEDLHKIFLNATDLFGSRERISADQHVNLFKQLYLEIDGNWYPDALVPLEIAGVTPLELPDPTGPLASKQKVQAFWVDLFVPHELPPDTYRGQIMILHRNTNKQAILRVELEVGDFTLPDQLSIDIDLMNYGFLNIERGWPDVVLDSPRYRAIEREFFRQAHAHRMTFAIVPYNHDGSIPKGMKPDLAGVGDSVRVADWTAWDARFGPLLSGEAFQDLPRRGQPVAHFFLPYNLMWPSDMRNWQKPAYRTEHLRISEAFRKHLAEKSWTKPLYEIYYNHKEGYNFFPWNLDEPTRQSDLDALSYLGKTLKESFPAADPVKVAFRMDIGHFHCENYPGCNLPHDSSRTAVDTLGPLVDLWNINSTHFWANLPEVRKLKAQGKTLYFYSGTPVVTESLIGSVRWGWLGYKYPADGICFWNATDWGDWDTDAPPGDPYTNAGGRYKGFSMIFYPGSKFGYDGPIPSLRLKAMRRGLQDYEYLRLLGKKGQHHSVELIKLAEERLLGRNVEYPALRRTLFDWLAGGK